MLLIFGLMQYRTASYSGHASAWKFAEGRGATTSRVSQHLARLESSQVEAYAK